MITTILPCDQCNAVDITGELPRKGRLCPVHYGMAIGTDPNRIRIAMDKASRLQAEQRVPKTFDNALAKAR